MLQVDPCMILKDKPITTESGNQVDLSPLVTRYHMAKHRDRFNGPKDLLTPGPRSFGAIPKRNKCHDAMAIIYI